MSQLSDWLNGTPTGGPNGDGRYPLTYADGQTYLVYCPAAQALNPALAEQPVELFSQQAQAAATTAETHATEADADRIAAQTAAANAAQSESNALASKNAAAASASTASTKATEAATSATNAADSASTANTANTNAQAAKTASEAARDKAMLWADASQDVIVEGTSYSAKHWAQKAQAAATGTLKYKGSWDANTAFPANPVLGDFWKVSVAGGVYNIGDQILYNGAGWDKIDNTEQVTSVAGRTGAVTLSKSDVGLGNVDNTSDANKPVSTATQTALNGKVDDGAAFLDAFAANPAYYNSTSGIDCNNLAVGTRAMVEATNTNCPQVSGVSFWYIETLNSYNGAATVIQRAYSYDAPNAKAMRMLQSGAWTAWTYEWNSGNFDPATKADASTTVTTNTTQTLTAAKKFSSSATSGTVSTEQPLTVHQGTAGADAFMTFHVVGDHAFQFGLDGTTNDLFVGGWSKGAVKYKVFHEGNFDPTSKQNVLGFTPVQQGTGVDQLSNAVKIGWSGSALKCTVDSSDQGTFIFGTKAQGSTANTVVERNSSGDIFTRLFRSEFGNQTTISGAMAYRVNNTTDNYIRFCSNTTAIKTWLGAVSNGGGVSGIVKLTQADYDALGTKDASTLYIIVG